jgi:hypothetical protein
MVTVTNEPGCSASCFCRHSSTYNITLAPVISCANYTLPWGVVATSSGDYSYSYSSVNDCDSTVTIHVTINQGYTITSSPVAACVNYTLPWGVVATSRGDYSHSYSSFNGCDSAVTIHVTINQNPNPAISTGNIVCNGSSSTFNAGSGYSSYAWSAGAITQTISMAIAGTYGDSNKFIWLHSKHITCIDCERQSCSCDYRKQCCL